MEKEKPRRRDMNSIDTFFSDYDIEQSAKKI